MLYSFFAFFFTKGVSQRFIWAVCSAADWQCADKLDSIRNFGPCVKRCTSARESIILCIVDMKGNVTCAAGEVVKQPGEDCAIVSFQTGWGISCFSTLLRWH